MGSKEDRDKFYTKMPVYTGGNVFFNGAQPCDTEENFIVDNEHEIEVRMIQEDGKMCIRDRYGYIRVPLSYFDTLQTIK